MFMFFWMVTSMAAIYYDIYVLNFTWSTLYGDLFLTTVGIEDYISRGFPFLTIFRANDNNYVLYLAIYLGYL